MKTPWYYLQLDDLDAEIASYGNTKTPGYAEAIQARRDFIAQAETDTEAEAG